MLYKFNVEKFIDELIAYDPSEKADEYARLAPLMSILMDESKTSQDIDFNSFTIEDLDRLMDDIHAIDPEEPENNDDENVLWQIQMANDFITFLMVKEPEKGAAPMISSYEDRYMALCRISSIKVAKRLYDSGYKLENYPFTDDLYDFNYFFNALRIIFGDYKILAEFEDEMADEYGAHIIVDDPELLKLSKLLSANPMRDKVFDVLKACLYRLEHNWHDNLGYREFPPIEEVDLVLSGRTRYSSIYFKFIYPNQPMDFTEEVEIFLDYKNQLKSFIAKFEAELLEERAVA